MPKYNPKQMTGSNDSSDEEQDDTQDTGSDSEAPASQESGDEESSESEGQSGARVPEAFQQKVDSLVQGATKPMLEYLRSVVMEREHELMKSETKAEKSYTFDTEGMPE